MENLSFEKVNLILELLNNLSKEQWMLIKKYIDCNFEKIESMNKFHREYNNTLNLLKKELLNLQN